MEGRALIRVDWLSLGDTLEGFGGEAVTLHVRKTGLPFFDALRLYGAMDLHMGLREDILITDKGDKWEVYGKRRPARIAGKDEAAFRQAFAKKKPECGAYCTKLRESILSDSLFREEVYAPATKAFSGLDSALQAGVRATSGARYATLQSSQTSESTCCVARIPLSDGLLAFAGKKRIESLGNIIFLPLFEGRIDLSKVVSPLRAWLGVPNVLCAQTLALLALKTSLFAEGYQDRLTGVVFNTNLSGHRSDNYSGLITIMSTAISKMDGTTAGHMYRTFRNLVNRAWKKEGRSYQATDLTADALGMAIWLMQPYPKHLSGIITAQERLHHRGFQHIFISDMLVKEVFQMTYGHWEGDYDAMREFARAVASAIYYARMAGEDTFEGKQKAWYDEVTMLRSAPSAKAFLERALILIEQGHRKHSQVGTSHRNEAFDPQRLLASIGTGRAEFEAFRDLFRMCLVQESTYQAGQRSRSTAQTELATEEAQIDQTTEDTTEGEQ